VNWSLQHIKNIHAKGTIRGWVDQGPKKPNTPKLPKGAKRDKGSKIKGWIELNLTYWCQAEGLRLERELVFHPVRKWRFDWAIYRSCQPFAAVEYEGIVSEKSRHTTLTGYTGDAEKYNAAQSLGWRVYRLTALNYKSIFAELRMHL
jgi:hypothetical protein